MLKLFADELVKPEQVADSRGASAGVFETGASGLVDHVAGIDPSGGHDSGFLGKADAASGPALRLINHSDLVRSHSGGASVAHSQLMSVTTPSSSTRKFSGIVLVWATLGSEANGGRTERARSSSSAV